MKLNNVRTAAKLHDRRENLLQLLGDLRGRATHEPFTPSAAVVGTVTERLLTLRPTAAEALVPIVDDQLREAILATEEQLRELGVEV